MRLLEPLYESVHRGFVSGDVCTSMLVHCRFHGFTAKGMSCSKSDSWLIANRLIMRLRAKQFTRWHESVTSRIWERS